MTSLLLRSCVSMRFTDCGEASTSNITYLNKKQYNCFRKRTGDDSGLTEGSPENRICTVDTAVRFIINYC